MKIEIILKKQRTWAGSIEYNVKTKKLRVNLRITKKNNRDGSITYGYTTNHYTDIHTFKKAEKK